MSDIKNETSALRYMDAAGDTYEGQAAQNFLQNKIRKNAHGRYTQEQIDRLMQSGGPAVVNASDGAIPGGQYYDSQNPTKNQGDGGAAGTGSGALDYSHMTGDSDTERNYREGNWGRGGMTAEEVAEKFGLDRSNEGRGEGHVWGQNPDGSEVYIGFAGDGLKSNSELIKAHSKQANPDEIDHSSNSEDLSSSGDVKGALLTFWQAQGGEAKEAVEEEENKPIEHSPEIRQAVDRVRTYENDVMSGKISDDIFGGGNSSYSFDHNKGSDGIGTAKGAESNIEAKATSSFLDAKKSDVKKAYNFQPASYGAKS